MKKEYNIGDFYPDWEKLEKLNDLYDAMELAREIREELKRTWADDAAWCEAEKRIKEMYLKITNQ